MPASSIGGFIPQLFKAYNFCVLGCPLYQENLFHFIYGHCGIIVFCFQWWYLVRLFLYDGRHGFKKIVTYYVCSCPISRSTLSEILVNLCFNTSNDLSSNLLTRWISNFSLPFLLEKRFQLCCSWNKTGWWSSAFLESTMKRASKCTTLNFICRFVKLAIHFLILSTITVQEAYKYKLRFTKKMCKLSILETDFIASSF